MCNLVRCALSLPTEAVGDLNSVDIIERDINIADLKAAYNKGRLLKAFVVGTAVHNLFVNTLSKYAL
jgi:hypothetical protein